MMIINDRRFYYSFFCVLYIGSSLLTAFFGLTKFRALDYHGLDFTYYLEFSVKVFDRSLSHRFSGSPGGINFLNFFGIDGGASLHQGVHFEPVKYIFGSLYYFFPYVGVLFFFAGAFYFLPLLYLVFAYRTAEPTDKLFAMLVGVSYALFPSALGAATYDLRPYSFFAPLLFMIFLAINLRRSLLGTTILFNTLFLIREEALFFGGVIILYIIFSLRGKELRERIRPFVVSWLMWAAVTATYFWWAGFARQSDGSFTSRFGGVGLVVCVIGLSILASAFRKKFNLEKIVYFPLLIGLLPIVWVFIAERQTWSLRYIVGPLLYDARWSLLWVFILALIFILWQTVSPIRRWRFLCVYGTASIVIIVFNFLPLINSVLSIVRADRLKAIDAAVVFQMRDRTRPGSSFILTDDTTHKAFPDFEHVFAYEALPAYMITSSQRYYPENRALLSRLLKEKIEYIVISNANVGVVLPLAKAAGGNWVLTNHSGSYSIFERGK